MTFAADVSRFSKKTGAAVDLIVRKVTFDLFREVVQRTPVDTGRLKGNWQVSQGSPVTGTITTTDPDGSTTTARIAAGMGGWGSVTFLTNNLPYASRIEYDGWSHTKAPAGMVRVSFARVQQIARNATRQHKV